ncbi:MULTISPECIES: CsgG/HfaB family protein [unclassified Saccharibacter]|uniref:CsgG/HfaB family protein n=1 Tax=unclassified Saccharibacter TaxID=2648722 RepID=UPI001325A34F|nr:MULTISPECIES: CsgG/HfaB family protein [unclassified Saccharibacter]MXV35985.1 hypothetical protein [Saccharibacter sp. EH611]MXV56844.1 hypothetical protein [Saccharibacter sp. EH70]MXV66796.1 hypothetical protein [Saccharibacter sp. EH60]
MKTSSFGYILLASMALTAGCATESSHTLPVEHVTSTNQPYQGPRPAIAIGQFQNRSHYMNGLFSSGTDYLGNQAKTILASHLQESNHFNLMDRSNLDAMAQEGHFSGTQLHIKGARFLVTGDVTEFGRKETGDQALFGMLGQGRKQIAYAKVALNIVNVDTSEVVYTVQGAGDYQLSNREIVGFGGSSSYDSTLNDKVLDLAIREAVNRLVEALDHGAWPFPSK